MRSEPPRGYRVGPCAWRSRHAYLPATSGWIETWRLSVNYWVAIMLLLPVLRLSVIIWMANLRQIRHSQLVFPRVSDPARNDRCPREALTQKGGVPVLGSRVHEISFHDRLRQVPKVQYGFLQDRRSRQSARSHKSRYVRLPRHPLRVAGLADHPDRSHDS